MMLGRRFAGAGREGFKRLCGVTLNDDEKAFLGGIFAER